MNDAKAPTKSPIPVDILAEPSSQELRIEWSDGHVSVYRYEYLRENCPCPGCTKAKGHPAGEEIALAGAGLKGVRVLEGGCLHFSYEDEHDGCTYTFERLREICPCDEHGREKARPGARPEA